MLAGSSRLTGVYGGDLIFDIGELAAVQLLMLIACLRERPTCAYDKLWLGL